MDTRPNRFARPRVDLVEHSGPIGDVDFIADYGRCRRDVPRGLVLPLHRQLLWGCRGSGVRRSTDSSGYCRRSGQTSASRRRRPEQSITRGTDAAASSWVSVTEFSGAGTARDPHATDRDSNAESENSGHGFESSTGPPWMNDFAPGALRRKLPRPPQLSRSGREPTTSSYERAIVICSRTSLCLSAVGSSSSPPPPARGRWLLRPVFGVLYGRSDPILILAGIARAVARSGDGRWPRIDVDARFLTRGTEFRIESQLKPGCRNP